MDKRRLDFHLQPSGNPDGVLPSVKDSDGNVVLYTGAKRITDETTVVDIGTSPNANDGDPIRTSFIKINNFIEASYHTNYENVELLRKKEFHGPFLGTLAADDFKSFQYFQDQQSDNGTWDSDGRGATLFKIAILNETLESETLAGLNSAFPNVTLDTTNSYIRQTNNRFFIRRGSIILYRFNNDTPSHSSNVVEVIWQPEANEATFNYSAAFSRLANGTANSLTDSDTQKDLAFDLNQAAINTNTSHHIGARNVEDAIVEMYARISRRGLDAGYFG